MSDLKRGMQAATPTVLGYASIGLACGILAAQSGLSPAETALMSLIVYSGSAQFAICGLVVAQTNLFTGTLTIFLMNLRNLLLNLHATTLFKDSPFPQQVLVASMMTDESYGIMLKEQLDGQVTPIWMMGNNLAGYLSWFVFSLLGSLIGGLLPAPERLGVDFALIAMFIAIFAGQLEALQQRLPVQRIGAILTSIGISYLVFASLMTSSLAVVIATLVGCLTGVLTDVD